jgi:hypothetical protein
MRQGVEVFVADGREVLQADAAIDRVLKSLPAIDGYLVSARCESGGKLFGEGFESPIISRDAAGAKQSDAHAYIRADLAASRAARRGVRFGACLLTGAYWNQLAMYS